MKNGLPSLDELHGRRAQMFPTLTPAQVERARRFGEEVVAEAGEETKHAIRHIFSMAGAVPTPPS